MAVRNVPGRAAAWCAGVLSLLLVASCAGPSWTYVTNSADKTYMKVPTTWHQVDNGALASKLGIKNASGSGMWFAAYDADPSPSVEHVFGDATEAPIMFVFVRKLPEAARGSYSLDTLRDLLNPVSPSAQQQAAMLGGGAGITTISDTVLTPGDGLHGVHVVYGKQSPIGSPQVYDQIGYLNDDASKLFLFVVQCSVQCYQDRQKEITGVVSSFTVREKP